MASKSFTNSFAVEQIYEKTWRIIDNAIGTVNLYLLEGEEKALLIDSGFGNPELKAVVSKLTDKPVICACTHGHIDHAMGAYLFEDRYLHSKDISLYKEQRGSEHFLRCGLEGMGRKPTRELKLPGYKENVELLASIQRGDLTPLDTVPGFELGARRVSWFPIPGHTQGSVAFYDEQHRTVFDGDAAGKSVWLFVPEASSVEDYAESLESYRDFLKEHAVRTLYGGHGLRPFDGRNVQAMIDACRKILVKRAKGKDIGIVHQMPVGQAHIFFSHGCAIYY